MAIRIVLSALHAIQIHNGRFHITGAHGIRVQKAMEDAGRIFSFGSSSDPADLLLKQIQHLLVLMRPVGKAFIIVHGRQHQAG